jgi:hypothetical protein
MFMSTVLRVDNSRQCTGGEQQQTGELHDDTFGQSNVLAKISAFRKARPPPK